MNFVTIMANIQSAGDYYPMVDVALADMVQQYPALMANYSWSHFNTSKDVNTCTPDDQLRTYSAVSKFYGEGMLQQDGALTVVFIPSE